MHIKTEENYIFGNYIPKLALKRTAGLNEPKKSNCNINKNTEWINSTTKKIAKMFFNMVRTDIEKHQSYLLVKSTHRYIKKKIGKTKVRGVEILIYNYHI